VQHRSAAGAGVLHGDASITQSKEKSCPAMKVREKRKAEACLDEFPLDGDKTSGFSCDLCKCTDGHVDGVVVVASWACVSDCCCHALAIVRVDDEDLLAA